MKTTIYRCFNLLSSGGKKTFVLSIIIQLSTSILDILGIGFIAATSIFALKLFGPESDSASLDWVYNFFDSITHDDHKSIYLLASLALSLFIFKTVLSAVVLRKQLQFLVQRDSELTKKTINSFINNSIHLKGNSQEYINSMTTGLWLASTEILGNLLIIISELSLLVLIVFALSVVNLKMMFLTFIYFLMVFIFINKYFGKRLFSNSKTSVNSGIKLQSIIRNVIEAKREIFAFKRGSYFSDLYIEERVDFAKSSSLALYYQNIPKMFLESALVLGVFILVGFQMFEGNAVNAVLSLSVYLAAGSRILPALVRLQGGFSALTSGRQGADLFLDLMENNSQKSNSDDIPKVSSSVPMKILGPVEVSVEGVSFKYEGDSKFSISNLNLFVTKGTSCAITGDSGSGKSTIIDLILGILTPNEGVIKFDGLLRDEVDLTVGFVPQDVSILTGTIRENVCFGAPENGYSDSEIWEALRLSGIDRFVETQPLGLETILIENGTNLSGGQKQRIAIARALITKPNLLILDEAMSGLNPELYFEVQSHLLSIKNMFTLIAITHNHDYAINYDSVIKITNNTN